jgi:hypothetical protein
MPHNYKWADAEHTVVQRDDGRSFVWPKGTNVANINGRIAEEYRVEGSPKILPYTPEPVAAAKPKQQTKPPAIPTVADAEQVLADLKAQREKLTAERLKDDAEMGRVSFQAHALHELGASRTLSEISTRAIERDQRLREIDAAIAEARERLAAAQAAESAAAGQARAEELRKHVDELSQIPAYIEKHLTAALKGLIAFERGVAELHQLGVAFPTDIQLRLGMVAVLGTWLQQLPKLWWNEIAAGLPFRAPNERKSALSYWAQLEPGLRNIIATAADAPVSKAPAMQRSGAADRREAAAAEQQFLHGR